MGMSAFIEMIGDRLKQTIIKETNDKTLASRGFCNEYFRKKYENQKIKKGALLPVAIEDFKSGYYKTLLKFLGFSSLYVFFASISAFISLNMFPMFLFILTVPLSVILTCVILDKVFKDPFLKERNTDFTDYFLQHNERLEKLKSRRKEVINDLNVKLSLKEKLVKNYRIGNMFYDHYSILSEKFDLGDHLVDKDILDDFLIMFGDDKLKNIAIDNGKITYQNLLDFLYTMEGKQKDRIKIEKVLCQ